MKRVLTAVVLVPLVLLVLFKTPLWLFTLVLGAVALASAWEYLQLISHYGLSPMKGSVLSFIALYFSAMLAGPWDGAGLLLTALPIFFVYPLFLLTMAMRTDDLSKALPRAASSAFAIPYVMIPLLCIFFIKVMINGAFFILFLLLVVWSGDVCAYYVGRTFGRHKLAPRISPGKSWEGAIASLVGSVFVGHLLFVDQQQVMTALTKWHLVTEPFKMSTMSHGDRFLVGMDAAFVINIAAQFGDLAESMLKRGAGVKDSGTLLPGHGGILDRIDALLFAAPIALAFAIFFH